MSLYKFISLVSVFLSISALQASDTEDDADNFSQKYQQQCSEFTGIDCKDEKNIDSQFTSINIKAVTGHIMILPSLDGQTHIKTSGSGESLQNILFNYVCGRLTLEDKNQPQVDQKVSSSYKIVIQAQNKSSLTIDTMGGKMSIHNWHGDLTAETTHDACLSVIDSSSKTVLTARNNSEIEIDGLSNKVRIMAYDRSDVTLKKIYKSVGHNKSRKINENSQRKNSSKKKKAYHFASQQYQPVAEINLNMQNESFIECTNCYSNLLWLTTRDDAAFNSESDFNELHAVGYDRSVIHITRPFHDIVSHKCTLQSHDVSHLDIQSDVSNATITANDNSKINIGKITKQQKLFCSPSAIVISEPL